jgi:hypothetical protein
MEQLLPVTATRDEDGYFRHPALDHFWNVEMDGAERGSPEQWEAWEERNGVETRFAHLESEDMDHPAYVEYFDNGGNASLWGPAAPSGEGWFLINIGDSEDGPFAVFARHMCSVPR